MRASTSSWGPIERLEERRLLSISLLADLNGTTLTSTPGAPVTLGSDGYFSANDGVHGSELWRTDGTAAGTQMVKDISPGVDNGFVDDSQGSLQELTNVEGKLFFAGSDGVNGLELWTSDGTANGTNMVKNIAPGSTGSLPEFITDFNGTAVFTTSYGYGIWRSDGTDAGTYQIAAAASGDFAQLGGNLYFLGSALGSSSVGLWKSDGTPSGTSMIRQFSSLADLNIVALNGKLYFSAADSALNTGTEPWSSDGTEAGTVPLGDLYPGTDSSSPTIFAALGSAVYFAARPASFFDTHLYRTDGTANGTVSIADVGDLGAPSTKTNLVAYNDALYFAGNDLAHGTELWRTDGTASGTGLFDELVPGNSSSAPQILQPYAGRLYFVATTLTGGREVYSTDGTVAGTTLLKDIAPGTAGIGTGVFPSAVLNNRFYFRANDVFHGAELWSTDGTAGGTTLLTDINFNTASSNPSAMTAGPVGFSYFTATDGLNGTQLWKTDGTAAGTSMITTGLSSIGSRTFVNGVLLFAASDSAGGLELWSSDGTPAGTTRVKDILPGTGSGLGSSTLVKVGNRVFFTATTDTGTTKTYGLWVSDGTTAGTHVVKAPSPIFNLYPNTLSGIDYGGKLMFYTAIPESGAIFISDGTDAGTSVFDTFPGNAPTNWTVFNGKVYFTLTTSVGNELWSSDGTTFGTQLVSDIYAGPSDSSPGSFVNTGDALYFAATDATNGRNLWRIDQATSTLTRLTTKLNVQQIRASAQGGLILVAGSNQIYHFDGTSAVALTSNGKFSSAPTLLGSASALDYFSATTSSTGTELWMTDGTAGGTVIVQDLAPGSASSLPQNLSVVNGNVFISATTPAIGRELFVIEGLLADANRDGYVNTLDFTILAQNFNHSSATFSQGDFNYDGVVNALDFDVLATHFGAYLATAPAGAQPLAESSPLAMRAVGDLFANQPISPEMDVLAGPI